MQTIPSNPTFAGIASVRPDITFAVPDGRNLKLTLMQPWDPDPTRRHPLIVFLQGAGWTSPDRFSQLPQLAQYARHGYVVASITHRNFHDGYPAPAWLEDAKTAIRFLRHNAESFRIDPDKVAFWGTSSGGHAAELIDLTGDDPRYKTKDFPDESDAVTCVVSCFGVADMLALSQAYIAASTDAADLRQSQPDVGAFVHLDKGEEFATNLMVQISPSYQIDNRTTGAPILLIHGTADQLVPFQQSQHLAEQLTAAGIENEFIAIEGGDHDGTFWSQAVHDAIMKFLDAHLK